MNIHILLTYKQRENTQTWVGIKESPTTKPLFADSVGEAAGGSCRKITEVHTCSDWDAVGEKVSRFLSNVTKRKCSKPASFCRFKCVFPLSDKHLSGAPSDLSHPSLIVVTLEVCRLTRNGRLLLPWLFFLKQHSADVPIYRRVKKLALSRPDHGANRTWFITWQGVPWVDGLHLNSWQSVIYCNYTFRPTEGS